MGVLPSFEGRTNYISSLDDVVANKTVELKQAFDQAGTDLKDYLAVLKAYLESGEGASALGAKLGVCLLYTSQLAQ